MLSCGELIEEHKGTCTCQFVWNGDDAFLPALLEDCVTSETLRVRNRFRGSGEGPGNQSTQDAQAWRIGTKGDGFKAIHQ